MQNFQEGAQINAEPIFKKLKILTFLPAVIIALGFLSVAIEKYNDLNSLLKLELDNQKIVAITKLINDLQQERGYTSGYLASEGKFFSQELAKKQKDVDKDFLFFIQKNNKHYKDLNAQLQYIREFSKEQSIATYRAFEEYSDIIDCINKDFLKSTLSSHNKETNRVLRSYTNLSFMKESLGQIRGVLNALFSQQGVDVRLIHKALFAEGIFSSSQFRFLAIAPPRLKEDFTEISLGKNYIFVQNVIHTFFQGDKKDTKIEPYEWFERSTSIINQLYRLEQKHLNIIENYSKKNITAVKIEFFISIAAAIFFFILTLFLSLRLKDDISRSIKLLNEYKNAVDRSSIVSKTDKRGIITYVNEKFCKISGYTPQELIGKNHNIVRHPDMPKSAFKHMWRTIMAKQPWFGIVKNRTKDGGTYIVEVTINPILDQKGNIEEFIAIRNDITSVIRLHEELEHTQEDLIFRMGEIGETRSQETGFHVRRVASYSKILAKHYGLSKKEIQHLFIASPMHDIGKVGVPDAILHKTGTLTHEEWSIMQKHAEIGHQLFKDSDKPLLQAAAIIAYEHHEKWDGSGYPRGLSGENIHIYGRITALADVFDALGSDRCYKKAWSDEKIFEYIKEQSGKQFDPKLVSIFFEHLDEFLAIRDKYKEESSFMQEH